MFDVGGVVGVRFIAFISSRAKLYEGSGHITDFSGSFSPTARFNPVAQCVQLFGDP